MAEVSKRDKIYSSMSKIGQFINRITNETPPSEITVRITELNKRWEDYQRLHEDVLARTGVNELEEQDNILDETRELYFDLSSKLSSWLSRRTSTSTAKLTGLTAQLKAIGKMIEGINTYAQGQADNSSEGAIASQQRNLESLHQQMQALVLEIIANGGRPDYVMEKQQLFVESYLSATTLLFTAAARFAPVQAAAHHNEPAGIKLQSMKIAIFDGNQDCWESFRESFNTAIDSRPDLSGVQKLQQLKGYLSGVPEELVRNFTLTNANYTTAWNLLKKRYDNPKHLVYCHLKNIMSLGNCSGSAEDLRRLMNKTTCSLQALSNLNRPTAQWDDWIVHITVERFDCETRNLWEQIESCTAEFPTWEQLETFLESRVRSLDVTTSSNVSPPKSKTTSTSSSPKQPSRGTSSSTVRAHQAVTNGPQPKSRFTCPICCRNHSIRNCSEFRGQAVEERRRSVSNKKICFNCLGLDHRARNCPSDRRCMLCNELHHTLLHIHCDTPGPVTAVHPSVSTTGNNDVQAQLIQSAPVPDVQRVHIGQSTPHQRVLLATALVNIKAHDGAIVTLRALLDQGSQVSFVTESVVQALQLPKTRVNIMVSGLGSSDAGTARSMVSMPLLSRVNQPACVTIDALVLGVLTNLPPHTNLQTEKWNHLTGIELADPQYHSQHKIDMLLGADIYGALLLDGIRRGAPGMPIAQNTIFGWIISGPVNTPLLNPSISCHTISVEDQLRKFWELEEVFTERVLTADEEACEQFYAATYKRDQDGRFIVRLPVIPDVISLGESMKAAVQRQTQMERKFIGNNEFREQYCAFMSEYENMHHMEPISGAHFTSTTPSYYIPHHAVLKESSTTTKLRVVFDASRCSSNGLNLNGQLYIGPRLQQELTSIAMRWRKHNVVFTADITKMYRQIKVDPADCDLQRIVWRSSQTEPMQSFRLTTVTYGTSAAPYLAVKTLQQLAINERSAFPIGSEIALRDMYVDDVLSGADDVPKALEAQHQLTALLQSGGFPLRKWASNHEELLSHLPHTHRECSFPLNLDADSTIKTLGIFWNPRSDDFTFKIDLPPPQCPPTKRSLLSDAARLYDPLGWVSPSVLLAKMLFQTLWKTRKIDSVDNTETEILSWDDNLPTPLAEDWLKYRADLMSLTAIRIPRWIGSKSDSSTIELHGFCDASMKAYAAAVYVRVSNPDGNTQVSLLASKTKVAPLRTVSLPRLELCGAVLLTRLMQSVEKAMDIPDLGKYVWTDSTIVLSWINGHPTRWCVFVSNRIAEIQKTLPIQFWNHVRSEDNPADCASRGVLPSELQAHKLWWNGPDWLCHPMSSWPPKFCVTSTDEEQRSITFHTNIKISVWQLVDKYEKLSRLLRVTAYCLRFATNVRRRPVDRLLGSLTPNELLTARTLWVKITQQQHFSSDLSHLQKSGAVDKHSALLSLSPFLDTAGVLRVGGRLRNAIISYDEKHPIILPKKGTITKLLVSDAHLKGLHGGTQVTLGYLRRTFWIIDGRNLVRHHIHRCVTCVRFRTLPQHQIMADLPAARVSPSRPFLHSAVDFSGAIMVRSARGRGQHATKGYISVFVCLVTKAIHLELVSDLTSIAFIAAYKRFSARRGVPSDVYSDNGTNFVGAAAELRKHLKDDRQAICNALSHCGTKWHFSPPLTPHFNGLAESGVRSVKHHLRRIVGESTLTYEELTTFLAQVESVLNSRPCYPLTNDPTDLSALTPGHFIIGEAITTVPEPNLLDRNTNHLNRWQLVQQMHQHFWRRWSAEYMHHLQQRQKWRSHQRDLQPNDMVLVKEDNMPPSKWLLGRVVQTHPGADGHVRVVTVRCQKTTIKRSVVKLILLPTNQEV